MREMGEIENSLIIVSKIRDYQKADPDILYLRNSKAIMIYMIGLLKKAVKESEHKE
jgi:hypothetical protein